MVIDCFKKESEQTVPGEKNNIADWSYPPGNQTPDLSRLSRRLVTSSTSETKTRHAGFSIAGLLGAVPTRQTRRKSGELASFGSVRDACGFLCPCRTCTHLPKAMGPDLSL